MEHPISPEEFSELMDRMLGAPNVYLISPGKKAVTEAVHTAARLGLTSHRIYDLRIYGTMREHGIERLATINVKHFSGLDGIELFPIL